MLLSCQNIALSFGDKEVLNKVNFNIEEKEKAALIGINGAGKTTLLRVILGELEPDSGAVVKAPDISIGYLSQHQDIMFDNTVYGEMFEAKRHIIDMEKRLRELEKEMKSCEGERLERILAEYNRLQTKFDNENGYAYESEIVGVLTGLGFDREDYDRHINTLSGGQKMRIALGRILLTHPDLVILDEPTNHLDIASLTWLEGFLSGYKGAVLLVSHDRYFIDKISDKIIEIDQGISTVFKGSYSYYSEEKARIREARIKAYMNQQAVIKHEEEVIKKLKSFNREKSIKRAESREKMLDKIEVLEKPAEVRTDMKLMLTPNVESGEDVLLAEHIRKSFGDNLLYNDITIDIKRGEHVALIGGNGTGKTTLLKIIDRLIPKDEGSIKLGARVKVGYFDQEHKNLSMDKTIFEELSDSFPDLGNTRIRNILAAFLFTGEDVFKKIGDLSGGEQGRVSLAKLMLSPANFLILDEPTNHLDIQSKEILEEAVRNYTGTLLYVSHDRYFVNRTATRILELRNKVLTNYIGDYDFYEQHRDEYYIVQNGNNPNAVEDAALTRAGFTRISNRGNAAEANVSGNAAGSISSGAGETGLGTAGAAGSSAAGVTGSLAAGAAGIGMKQPMTASKEQYLANKEAQAALRKKQNRLKRTEEEIAEKEQRIEEIDNEINLPENGTNIGLLTSLSKEKEELEERLMELYTLWEELSE